MERSALLILFSLLSGPILSVAQTDCPPVSQCFNSQVLSSSLNFLENIKIEQETEDEKILTYLEVLKTAIKEYMAGKDPVDIFNDSYDLLYSQEEELQIKSRSKNKKNFSPHQFNKADDSCYTTIEDPMKAMLDAMMQMNTGQPSYDEEYYEMLHECFDYMDPNLSHSQIEAWRGIIQYWESNGTETDPWIQPGNCASRWLECNTTVTNLCNMIIYEPCNYASNVAYYHDVTEICAHKQNIGFSMDDIYAKALAQSFAMVGMGSSFMHGSNTDLGGKQDTRSNDLFPYVQHQGSISALSNLSPVVTDLSHEKREKTGVELAEEVTTMYYTESVYDWYDITNAFDLPDIETSFTAIITNMLLIGLGEEFVDCAFEGLTCTFGINSQTIEFFEEYYIPEFTNATQNLDLSSIERVKFIGNSIGTVLKLIYALLFQEDVLAISEDIASSRIANAIGGKLLPRFNVRAGQLQTFRYFDTDFQIVNDIYPGDYGYCNKQEPHAKWHLESAVGILDVTYLADQMHYFFSKMEK